MYDTYMDTMLPMPRDYTNRNDEELFALMRDADADEFNALCEEALRRGLVRG